MKGLYLATLVSLALAAPAEAARPTYSYLEASYLSSERDDGTSKSQGGRIDLNVSMAARWFYFAGEFDRLDYDDSEITSSATSLGFGVHSLKSVFQLFTVGSYERLDLNGAGSVPDSNDEGYGLQLGMRVPIGWFEFQGDYKYFNFGDLPNGERDDDDRYRAILQARVTKNMALTASYETFEQSKLEQWSTGLRFYFKTRYDLPRKKRPAAAASAQ